MPIDLVRGTLYGPQGPETKRAFHDNWGKHWEEALAGGDDEGVIEKTLILQKYTFPMATMFAIFDINMFNTRGGIPNILQRMKFHYVPWLGIPVAYTSTVACVSALRGGKTDQKNHLAGGVAAGAVLGKLSRNFQMGMVTGVFFAILGYYYKDSKMKGYEVFPAIWNMNARHGWQFTHKMDFTTNWFEPRPGYWARSEEEVEKVRKQGQLGDGDYNRRLW